MTRTQETCIDCHCKVSSSTVKRDGRHLETKETIFSCGASKREISDREGNNGRVEFEGCCCAA